MSLKILFGVTEVLGKRIRKVVAFMYQLASTTAIMILPDSNPRDLENSLAKPEKYDLYAFPRKGLIPLNISTLYHGFSDKANEISQRITFLNLYPFMRSLKLNYL